MAELTSMRKLKWAKKKKEIQNAVEIKLHQASKWVKQNREALKVMIPATVVGLNSVAKVVQSTSRKQAMKHDIRDRQIRFYDHQLGCYWYTKRPLRTDELLAVKRRKAAGESYGDIFQSMKLLK